ncbi:hypothetical protein G6F46_005887 [Rhizopus delemar]|uniref:FHA domain-containing protein n=1 Tax=Rhizopus oryzae TaxID=64495 RepID=A0A9P6YBZ4_RHIOR|nr:hypothetical protein G6F55_005729 [Rhizopus delemar]KAG1544472.1 hypothetical protein G6F51_006038 [Rhizopus arrhizus]KAG1496558.1 hypothetical protein G6F54_006383 [Rhizopus delemar]KAG1511956.1 hypothetical protein G6F53_005548 [Rhizopus delemar]KAG1597395.1 hypothetical protein G6F47_007355 [Rhizopus delemar]
MTEALTVAPIHEDSTSTVKLTKQKGSAVVTVILKPHNSNFQTRTLELKDKSRIKIGRQTSNKTAPTALNGYFDSKVLSRQHAEIFYDKHRVYIKDVKSSNGTFVNGNRLSNEGEESMPCEIKSSDKIEFGIDIINDNGSVMYHKVSCLVYIYPIPLSQVDDSMIKEANQLFPPTQLSRHSSVDTLSNDFMDQIQTCKPNDILETILMQLQTELVKSKRVQEELNNIKDSVNELDKSVEQDNKHDELNYKLKEAEKTIQSFDERWKYQKQAIETAKNELCSLERQVSDLNNLKLNLSHELQQEIKKSKLLEQQLQEKSINTGTDTKNMIFMFILGIFSAIFYSLYH